MADALRVYLGHGASGSAATMAPWVSGLRDRGVEAETVPRLGKLPTTVERAIDVYRAQVTDPGRAVIGGVSYGGRVASMIASEDDVAGLVLLSYPLHPPGKVDRQRVDHLSAIRCPVLLLSGESDPFARIDLLRAASARLARAELVTYPRVGHGLSRDPAVMADALDRVAAFVRELRPGRAGART